MQRAMRVGLLAIAVFSTILCIGLLQYRQLTRAEEGPTSALLGSPIAPKFTLVDQEGKTVTEAMLQGKWSLVFFGFTYCPDICPTTLANLTAAKMELPPELAAQLQLVFVSVDHERDNPEVMKGYIAPFEPGIVGLSGSAEAIAAAAKSFHVYYRKVEQPGSEPTWDHSSVSYLLGPDGGYADLIPYANTPHDTAMQLSKHMTAR